MIDQCECGLADATECVCTPACCKHPNVAQPMKLGRCANDGKCECDYPQCQYPGSPCVAL